MLREISSSGSTSHEYVHRDHLGSVTALTRETDGSIIERYSYDAWGQRRSATDWTTAVTTAYEQRGYTGHEHLDDIGIIHMNGRVYDPKLGRMLSPDPVTQAPENGQNYNRYSYAYNNPLKYSDLSGFVATQELSDAELTPRRGSRYPSPGFRFPSGPAQLGQNIYMAADFTQAGYGMFRTVPIPLAELMGPYAFQSEIGSAGFMTVGSVALSINDLLLFATTWTERQRQ